MTYPLFEKTRERSETGRHFVIEDYTKTPSLCRHGVWVGRPVDFSDTVLMSFEHGQDDLSVGWIVNGAAISPEGCYAPCQGAPTIRYRCPGDGRNLHTISLMSTPGSDQDCVDLQVVFTPPPQWNPLEYGPSKKVCLQGRIVEWPWFLLQQEQECWERFRNVFEKYVVVPRPAPAPPGSRPAWSAPAWWWRSPVRECSSSIPSPAPLRPVTPGSDPNRLSTARPCRALGPTPIPFTVNQIRVATLVPPHRPTRRSIRATVGTGEEILRTLVVSPARLPPPPWSPAASPAA